MASITTRAAKGTPLTHAEVDANFTNLNADKLDVAGIAAGTAASPTVKFTGDTNTGIYSPGADQLSISTGGTERFRIDNNGQLEAVSLGSAASPTYSFTTDPDTGLYSPGANQVALATGGTGRLFVDASGNVGVGAASPSAPITFGKSTYGSFDDEAFYRIKFQDVGGVANDVGIGQQGSGSLGFNISAGGHFAFYGGASNGERLRITSAGQVRLAGAGITFNGDTATANELDDYEEGTFTPTVIGTSTAGTVLYGTRIGRYTKVGRLVFIEIRLSWSAGTGAGELRISGLPFTSAGDTYPGLAIAFTNILTLTAGHVATSRVFDATTEIQILSYPTGGGTAVNVAYDAEAQIGVAGFYTV